MLSPSVKKYGDKAPYMVLDCEPPRLDSTIVQVFNKKKPGSRVWMRFDSTGASEFLELDRNAIMQRASIPARDLRILGPVFSQSAHILGKKLGSSDCFISDAELLKTDGPFSPLALYDLN